MSLKEYYIKHAKEDLDSTGIFERTYELAREKKWSGKCGLLQSNRTE